MRRLWRWIKSKFRKKTAPIVIKVPNPPVIPSVTDRAKKFMRTNMAGIILITRFEGFYPEPYLCPAGVPTIGYGTIIYPNGVRVKLSDPPCTKSQAKEWLSFELREKENYINTWLIANNITLTENQFSAIISFAYNLGTGRVTRGDVAEALKSGDMDRVAKAMSQFNKARNRWGILRELRGLTRRRTAEIALFKGIDR